MKRQGHVRLEVIIVFISSKRFFDCSSRPSLICLYASSNSVLSFSVTRVLKPSLIISISAEFSVKGKTFKTLTMENKDNNRSADGEEIPSRSFRSAEQLARSKFLVFAAHDDRTILIATFVGMFKK